MSSASSESSATRLWKWGEGSSTPQALSPLTDVVQVAAGGRQSLFLTASHGLFSCHREDSNTPRPVPLPPSVVVASISCSDSHCGLVSTDGHAYLWSSRSHKNSPFPLTPTVVPLEGVRQVSCGRYHTLFVTTDGSVYGLGKCSDGSLGIGLVPSTVTRALTPVPVPAAAFGSVPVRSVVAGSSFSLFLTTDGSVYAAGDNSNGQIGQPLSGPRFFFDPTPVHTFAPVAAVWAGEQTAALLDTQGALWMAGKGDEGQLGAGADSRAVFVSGLREVALGGRTVRGCALGFAHSAVVVEEEGGRQVMVWGRGREGQLGRGDQGGSVASGVDVPKRVTALAGKDVVAIALGSEHTLALVRE